MLAPQGDWCDDVDAEMRMSLGDAGDSKCHIGDSGVANGCINNSCLGQV